MPPPRRSRSRRPSRPMRASRPSSRRRSRRPTAAASRSRRRSRAHRMSATCATSSRRRWKTRASLPTRCSRTTRRFGSTPRHGLAISARPAAAALARRLADARGRREADAQCRRLEPARRVALRAARPALQPCEQRRCAEAWVSRLRCGRPSALPARGPGPASHRLPVRRLPRAPGHRISSRGPVRAHDRQRFEVVAYLHGTTTRPARCAVGCSTRSTASWTCAARPRSASPRNPRRHAGRSGGPQGPHGRTPYRILRTACPLQVHYLGYPGTVGGRLVDYLIGDAIVTPPEHEGELCRDAGAASGQLPGQRPPASHRPAPGARRSAARGRRGVLQFQRDLEAASRGLRCVAADPPRGARQRALALARRPDDPAVENLRREFRRARPRGEPAGVRRGPAESGVPRGLRARRPRATPGRTTPTPPGSDALWPAAGAHAGWGDLRRAGRREPLPTRGTPRARRPRMWRSTSRWQSRWDATGARADLRERLATEGRASPLFDTVATTRALETAYFAMVGPARRGVRLRSTFAEGREGPSPFFPIAFPRQIRPRGLAPGSAALEMA